MGDTMATTARGRLSLLPLLRPPLLLSLATDTTAVVMVTDMDTVTATAMDTMATMARGMLRLLLWLLLSPDMATTAVDTDTVTVMAMATAMDMATVMDMATATTAGGRLMPSLDMATTATMDTVTDMAMATDVATDTAMDTATTVRERTDCLQS